MTAPITTKSVRYHVVDSTGTVLDVFNQKTNAVAKAFAFATEFRGDTFYVVQKSLEKEVTILELMIQMNFKFADGFGVFEGIEKASAAQKKKIRGAYKKDNWRP